MLLLLRSAGSPVGVLLWNFATRGCNQGGAALFFVLYFFEFGRNPHPACRAFSLIATRCGCVEAVLRSMVRILPVIEWQWIFCPYCPCLFSALSQVCLDTRRMSSDARGIILRGSARQSCGASVVICAAIAARGLARRLRRARVSALPVTQLESAPPRSFAGAFSLFFRRHS